MTATFDVRADGRRIRCVLTTAKPLAGPVLCFSLMAPAKVVSGGKLLDSLGGHVQIALPDLRPGKPHIVTVEHRNRIFAPANRAWLPLGPYIRHRHGILELPPAEPGPRTGTAPTPAAAGPDALMLCPPPTASTLSGGTVDASRGFACTHEAFATVATIAVHARTHDAPFLSPQGLPVTIGTDKALPPEGYFLVLAPEGIRLTAADRAGLFYGAITLRHLQITHGARIPAARIAWSSGESARLKTVSPASTVAPTMTSIATTRAGVTFRRSGAASTSIAPATSTRSIPSSRCSTSWRS